MSTRSAGYATPTDHAVVDSAASGGAEKRGYVKQIFSDIAPSYDLLNHLLSLNIDKRWRKRAIRSLDVARDPTGIYLDLCAGTLDVSAQLAATTGFAGRIVAADFAEPMLRAGRAKVSPSVVGPVTADALELPIKPNTMAGALVAFGIRNVMHLDECLHEVLRVLRPGARFVILEFTTPRNPVFRTLYQWYFHTILPQIGGLVSGHRTAYAYLPKSVAHFPPEPELAARLRAAGFVNVQWRTLSMGIAAIHVGEKP